MTAVPVVSCKEASLLAFQNKKKGGGGKEGNQ